MPGLTLPGFDLVAGWQAVQADGVTPSAFVTIAQDNATATPSGDTRSVRIDVRTGALAHIARRTQPAQDLSAHDELRLVMRSDRPVAHPPTIEVRLGSAALAIGAAGNTWHRRLPPLSGGWDLVRFSLDDLPAAVRGAVTVVEFQCLDDARDVTLWIDEALAVRPSMVVDTEQALVDRLNNQFVLGGNPVPAQVVAAGAALPAVRPCIAILSLAIRLAQERAGQTQRGDFTAIGYRLRPAPTAYEMVYAIEPLAQNRADQAAIADWLLSRLPLQGTLRVDGLPFSFEQMVPPPTPHELIPVAVPRQWLACRVWAWQQTGATTPVRPAETVVTKVDSMEPANV